MSSRNGNAYARNVMANVAVAGLLTVGAAVAFSATAAADDGPPPDPAVPADPGPPPPPPPLLVGATIPVVGAPLGPEGLNLLAQTGTNSNPGSLGLPAAIDTSPGALIGQNLTPSAPGAGVLAPPPDLNALNKGYMVAQNEKPSAPGQGTEVGAQPGQDNADLGRFSYVQQWHNLYKNGNLKGALLGRVPQDQLGQPLPGTAPPPGTNIPPGLVQDLPDPADAPVPGAPPAPGTPPVPGAPVIPVPPAVPAPPPGG
jgi:hypothetical protein